VKNWAIEVVGANVESLFGVTVVNVDEVEEVGILTKLLGVLSLLAQR
jgi:hypothetical protein